MFHISHDILFGQAIGYFISLIYYFLVAVGMASQKTGRSYLTWTDQMDKAMLDVFVDHYNKGDRAQNGWKPHVYAAAVKNVRDKCEKQITKDHIISRNKTFDNIFKSPKRCSVKVALVGIAIAT